MFIEKKVDVIKAFCYEDSPVAFSEHDAVSDYLKSRTIHNQ